MVGKKYRDEKRPRAGLLRGREFLMKDMYSFDVDEKAAMKTYNEVREAYDWFFNQIGFTFVTVLITLGYIHRRWTQREEISGVQYVMNTTMFQKV
jgi:prolyl-tRNA synthetase